jgi:transposase-like protein
MTAEQFDLLATFIRSRGPARAAARRILLDAVGPTDAAREVGISRSSAFNTARRIRTKYEEVCAASPWDDAAK